MLNARQPHRVAERPRGATGQAGDDARLRVVHVTKALGDGGMERLLLDMLPAMASHGVSASVLVVRDRPFTLEPSLRNAGIPVTTLGVRSLADPRWHVRVWRAVRATCPDVIHIHSPLIAAPTRLVARVLGIANLTTEHSLWDGYHRLTRVVNGASYRWSDLVVAVSPSVRSSIPPRLRGRTVALIHGVARVGTGGVVTTTTESRTAARESLSIGRDAVVIGCVANARSVKNLGMLVRAAAPILTREQNALLVHVGTGPDLADLRQLADSLGVQDRVLFLGHRADARELLPAFDVFALSSDSEGLPVAVMEALAAGLPVVATSVGGVADILRGSDAAQLVAAGDEWAFRAALDALVTDLDERARRARAAAELGATLDMEPAVATLAATYRALVRGRARWR